MSLSSMTTLRRATPGDAAAIAAIYAPYVRDTVISFEVEPPSAEEMRARIVKIGSTYPWIVAESGGRIVGYAYGNQHNVRAAYQWSADVTVYLSPDYWRKGLGRSLYGVLFPVLQRQGIRSLYAGITVPNESSVGLHRAIGMAEIGIWHNVGFKHGAWRDVMWMGMSFADDSAPKGPLQPCERLHETEVSLPV